MPFIDLNNTNNSGNQSTTPAANNIQVSSNSNGGTAPQNVQMSTDPATGIREIRGEDFPVQPAAQNLTGMQQPTPAPVQPTANTTPPTPAPAPITQSAVPQAAPATTNEVESSSSAQANPQVAPMPEPVAPVASAPETELVLGTNPPVDNTAPDAVPQTLEEQQQSQQEDVLPALPENQAMQDVMDRSLPKLETPPAQPDTISEDVDPEIMRQLKMEEDVEGLKTKNEQVALDSKDYGLDDLLKQTVEVGASDLHLSVGYRAMARVDGKLQTIKSQILTHEGILAMLEKVVEGVGHVDLHKDKDIDLSYGLPEADARFRVNIGYQRGTVMATFRLIPKHIRTPEELRLPPVVKEFTKYKQGLILVTGPTGSGKSTTLAGLVNHINLNEPSHIITIEDPIEYTYPQGVALVDQRAVHIDTTSWTMALRAALRQDPDVVLIGEMRDIETMEAALQVAETGHLVFSTLHTNTAAQTIDRVIDAFPEDKQAQVRSQLASVLMAVISQRLLPVAGGGRRMAAEVMVVTAGIRNAIREGKVFQIDNMIQTGAELGMVTMEKSLANLVREGQISTEMAQRYANKPEDVLSLLGRK